MFGTDPRRLASIDHQLREIDRKLSALMEAMNVALPEDDMADIWALARSGQKIEAIKLYRERTGAGLMEAKEAVDAACARPS